MKEVGRKEVMKEERKERIKQAINLKGRKRRKGTEKAGMWELGKEDSKE